MGGQRILMGVIGRAHGVRGLVRVHSYADGDLAGLGPLEDEAGRTWTIAWRGTGIAELRDAAGKPLPDRTAAERLVNTALFIDRDRLPAADADDFYWSDLVGLQAQDPAGAALGRVVQVHDYGGGPSLELEDGTLVPFNKTCVPAVDVASGTLTVAMPTAVELPLPLAGEGRGEGGDTSNDGRRERTTLTQPSPAGGRGPENGHRPS